MGNTPRAALLPLSENKMTLAVPIRAVFAQESRKLRDHQVARTPRGGTLLKSTSTIEFQLVAPPLSARHRTPDSLIFPIRADMQ